MTLQDQVCSLELAKKLKSLNVKQESLFYWKSRSFYGVVRSVLVEDVPELKDRAGYYSAFTVAELGEMLSKYNSDTDEIRQSMKGEIEYRIWVEDKKTFEVTSDDVIGAKTEANARAKMLIYLLENKLMEL